MEAGRESKRAAGSRYEERAAAWLEQAGLQILERNYRCRQGEIDLIAERRGTLVFVEVKLRKSADFAAAREFVDRHKQERLRQTALMFLAERETEQPVRFDVIEIYAPQGMQTRVPQINHLEDAFQ